MKVEHISESRVKQLAKEQMKGTEKRMNDLIVWTRNQNSMLETEIKCLKQMIEGLQFEILKENERRKFQNEQIIDGASDKERTR